MPTNFARYVHASALSLLLIGCGRIASPPTASDTGTDDSGSEPTSTGDPTSTTTTTGPGEGEASEGETDEPMFVPEEDWFVGNQCDPWTQDCPEGQKCVPYASSGGAWDATKCVDVLGSQAMGEPCSYAGAAEATDDCDATGYCWGVNEVDGELVGVCAAFCTGSPDEPMCPAGYFCPLAGDGTINLCHRTCDPIVQDCQEGTGCFWSGANFQCIFTTQDIPPGQPCGYINDCAPGSSCIDGAELPECAGSSCCAPFCELGGDPSPCAAIPGSVCTPFFNEDPPPELALVGYCGLGA